MESEIQGYRSGLIRRPRDFRAGWAADSKKSENSDSVSASGCGAALPGAAFCATENLPKSGTRRWVIRRKARVVAAVQSGLLTFDEACGRYELSREGFLSWQQLIDTYGLQGLRVTRVQDYRGPCRVDSTPSSKQRAADSATNPTE